MSIIAAVIADVIALAFLGWLAVTIAAPPLVVVIAIGAALMVIDTIGTLKRRENSA